MLAHMYELIKPSTLIERALTMERNSAGAAVADTTNKTAKRCVSLVEVLINKIRLFLEANLSLFVYLCLWQLLSHVDEIERRK